MLKGFDNYICQKVGKSYYFYDSDKLFLCLLKSLKEDNNHKFLRNFEMHYQSVLNSNKDYSTLVQSFEYYRNKYNSFDKIVDLLGKERRAWFSSDDEKIAFMIALRCLSETAFEVLVTNKLFSRKSKNGISFLEINFSAY